MAIIRNGNVALLNLRKPHVTLSILRKRHGIILKCHVACRYGLKRPVSPCQF